MVDGYFLAVISLLSSAVHPSWRLGAKVFVAEAGRPHPRGLRSRRMSRALHGAVAGRPAVTWPDPVEARRGTRQQAGGAQGRGVGAGRVREEGDCGKMGGGGRRAGFCATVTAVAPSKRGLESILQTHCSSTCTHRSSLW